MKKLPIWFLWLLCITSSMTCWSIWLPIGARFYIFDLVAFLFIASMVALQILGLVRWNLSGLSVGYTKWAWSYVGVAALTSVIIFVNPLGTRAWELFSKNLSALVTYTIVQTLVLMLMERLDEKGRERLYSVYVGMIVFSCLFMFVEVGLATRGFDLIRFIFDPISVAAPTADTSRAGYYQWDVFFRGNGFAGTNTQASYILPAIPLLLSAVVTQKRPKDFVFLLIAVFGLLLTMSRGGILGALVALVVFFALNWRRSIGVFVAMACIVAPMYLGFLRYEDQIISLFTSRGPIDIERLNMYADGLAIYAENPAGIGFAQYGVLFSASDVTFWRDANLHNNFLQVFVETGPIGLFTRLGLYYYVLWALLRTNTERSRAMAAGLTGLMVAGLFSSVLTTFQAVFCIVIFYALGVSSRRMPEIYSARSGRFPAVVGVRNQRPMTVQARRALD
jgi:hypothetical protein